jgi:hypothetical protein
MNDGTRILLSSITIFVLISLVFFGFSLFMESNLDKVQNDLAILSDTDISDVLSVSEQSNEYAYECSGTSPVVKVPNDFSTIQSAIDSVRGETIISVAPGVYNESIVLKPEVCLVGEEFGKVEIQGLGSPVIEASSKSKVENFKISSLGRSNIGISVVNAQQVNINMNTFENLIYGVHSSENSQLSVVANGFSNVDFGIFLRDSEFFVEQSNIQASSAALEVASSKGDVVGLVIESGEYGIKCENSDVFFDKNIFKKQTVLALKLCKEGEYELGNNFFDDVNEEVLYE